MILLIELVLLIAEGISSLFGGKNSSGPEKSEPENHPDWMDLD